MKISYSMAGMCVSAISIIFPTVAQAEDELKIKLGAHAFFDYENVEVGSATPVDGTNLRLFRVDVGGSYGDYKFKSNFDLFFPGIINDFMECTNHPIPGHFVVCCF